MTLSEMKYTSELLFLYYWNKLVTEGINWQEKEYVI